MSAGRSQLPNNDGHNGSTSRWCCGGEEAKNHEFGIKPGTIGETRPEGIVGGPGCWGELLKPIQQQRCLGWYTDEEREAGVECLQSYRCGPGTGLECY